MNWGAISAIGTVVGAVATVGTLFLTGFFTDKCASSRADIAAMSNTDNISVLEQLLAETPAECPTQRSAVWARIGDAKARAAEAEARAEEARQEKIQQETKARRQAASKLIGLWYSTSPELCPRIEISMRNDSLGVPQFRKLNPEIQNWEFSELKITQNDPVVASPIGSWFPETLELKSDGTLVNNTLVLSCSYRKVR